MTKNWKKITAEKFFFLFFTKTAIYLSLGLHKVCPSYRRSLQLSKEAIQHFKTWTFTHFCLLLWVIFALLDPDPDSEYGFRIRIRIHRPDWIRIQSGSGSTTLIQIRLIFLMRTRILVFYADPDSFLHTSPDPLQSERPWWASTVFYFDPDPVFHFAADLDTATENYADPDSPHWQQKHPLRGSIQLFINIFFWGGGEDGVFCSFLDPDTVPADPQHQKN